MTTPLPSSPGDAREDHAQQVADRVAAVYAQAELLLLATVAVLARKVAVGGMPAAVAKQRLDRTIDGVFASTRAYAAAGRDASAVADLLDAAQQTATRSAQDALAAVAAAADAPPEPGAFGQAVDRAIASTRGGLPGTPLSLSRVQAAQKALDDLAAQGITGFVDKTGRRWNLTSYVEMATRTAVSNAWDDHQAAALVRAGLDLVVVGTHSTEGSCPQCLPWLGRTLSLTGATPGWPTMADAKASGFRHPNCRCSWWPVGAGVAQEVTDPVPVDRAAAAYKAAQRQRALERSVRAAHRRAATAVTPQARAKARLDLAAARAASEQHRQHAGLIQTRASVRRREHGFRAH